MKGQVLYMEEEFGNDIITISDEDGNEYEMEIIDIAEIDDGLYAALIPADSDDTEEGEFVVLRIFENEETGEQHFENIDDEETLELVANEFIRRAEEFEASEGQ